MKLIRREQLVLGVGRPESQLYADGVDKARYDVLIKSFICKFFREDKKDYYFPYWEGMQMILTRSEFLSMLYSILTERNVIVVCQNVNPYLNHLFVLLGDNKYLVHQSGISRIVHDIKRITPYYNNTLQERLSAATVQRIHAYAEPYECFKRRWDNHVETSK